MLCRVTVPLHVLALDIQTPNYNARSVLRIRLVNCGRSMWSYVCHYVVHHANSYCDFYV